uniref:Uncharacterized protein n=1 Tax=Setaria italica TaxID=4555 RepID=K3ZPH5_SETIT
MDLIRQTCYSRQAKIWFPISNLVVQVSDANYMNCNFVDAFISVCEVNCEVKVLHLQGLHLGCSPFSEETMWL